MARFADLQDAICPHGGVISIRGSAGRCSLGLCTGETLRAYAASLNGHIPPKANGPEGGESSEPPAKPKETYSGNSNGSDGGGQARSVDSWLLALHDRARRHYLEMLENPLRAEVLQTSTLEQIADDLSGYCDNSSDPVSMIPPQLNAGEVTEHLARLAGVLAGEFNIHGQDLVVANGYQAPATASPYDLDNQPAISALRVYEADEFFDATADLENVEWLWDGIGPSCGMIGIFGDPEAGKSTVCRSLAMSWGKGEAFLGRFCTEIKVLYLDLAEETLSHRRALKALGWSRGNLKLVSQPSLIGTPNGMQLVENAINEIGARAIIVDMMADLLQFTDLNNYADAKRALRGARILAQRTKSLVLMLHHTPKALGPDADVLKAGLGSQAIVGAFDLRMAIRRRDKDLSTIVMSNGKMGGRPILSEHVLIRDPETERIELGGEWGKAAADFYVDRVVAYLRGAQDEELAASAIAEALKLESSWIRGSLFKATKDGLLERRKIGRAFAYRAIPEKEFTPPPAGEEDGIFRWEK